MTAAGSGGDPGAAAPEKAWLPYRRARAAAPRARVVAFHWAGGSASSYNAYPLHLPDDVELLAVQLPGREKRKAEAAPASARAAAAAAAAALGGVLGDVPYVVFGHSMGTLVAFEFAREVRRRGLPAPKLCVFSNFPAPQTPPAERPWRVSAGLSEAEFKDECRAWGVKPVVMTASFWPQFHLPFRADFKIFDQYEYAAEAPLGVPIKVFLSDRDPKVTRGLVEGWRAQTLAAEHFEVVPFAGDHFYLGERPTIPLVAKKLAALVRATLAGDFDCPDLGALTLDATGGAKEAPAAAGAAAAAAVAAEADADDYDPFGFGDD